MDPIEEKLMIYYLEQTAEEMRHIENLREKVTLLVVTLASAIVGFVIQQKFAQEAKVLMWFVPVLGLFGLLMVYKLYQVHQKGQARLEKWYEYLKNNSGSNSQVLILRKEADEINEKDFKYISKIKHSYFWMTIHAFIIGGGLYLAIGYPIASPISIIQNRHEKAKVVTKPTKVLPDKVVSQTQKPH